MNFIREEETKRVLSNCRSVTPQWLLDYFLEHDTDSDCDYIGLWNCKIQKIRGRLQYHVIMNARRFLRERYVCQSCLS